MSPLQRSRRSVLLQAARRVFGGDDLRGLIAFGTAIMCIHASRPTASYRTLELGGTAATVGLIAASYAAVSLFAAMPLGRQIDRRGPRAFFVGGIGVMGAGALASAAAPALLVLGVGQALLGVGQLATAVSFQTIIANRRHSNRDRGFARLAVAASTGQLLGPLLGGAILGLDPDLPPGGLERSVLVFGVCAGLAGLAFVAARGVERGEQPRTDPSEPAPARSSVRTIVGRRGVPQALLVGIAVLTTLDLLIAYLPVVGEARGIGPGTIGVLLSLRAGMGLLSRLTMTAMLRRLGRRLLLMSAMIAAALALVGIATVSSPVGLAVAIGIVGFCLGIGSPMTMAWLSVQTPRPDRGMVLAVRMTGNRISQVVMPTTAGGLAIMLGPGAIYVMLAATLLAGSLWVRQSPLE